MDLVPGGLAHARPHTAVAVRDLGAFPVDAKLNVKNRKYDYRQPCKSAPLVFHVMESEKEREKKRERKKKRERETQEQKKRGYKNKPRQKKEGRERKNADCVKGQFVSGE